MAIVITTQLTPIKLARSFSLAKEKNENRMFFFPQGIASCVRYLYFRQGRRKRVILLLLLDVKPQLSLSVC